MWKNIVSQPAQVTHSNQSTSKTILSVTMHGENGSCIFHTLITDEIWQGLQTVAYLVS